jgi:preprotein translocase subunit SecE
MIAALFTVLIYCLVLGIIVWLVNYLISAIPIEEPFARIARILVVVIAVLIVVFLLLSLVGVGDIGLPRLR